MRRISVFVILLCMSIVASSCDSKDTNVSETSSTSEVVETQVVPSDVTTVETEEEVVATSSSETETTETEVTETEETEPSVSETSVEETGETDVSETSETTTEVVNPTNVTVVTPAPGVDVYDYSYTEYSDDLKHSGSYTDAYNKGYLDKQGRPMNLGTVWETYDEDDKGNVTKTVYDKYGGTMIWQCVNNNYTYDPNNYWTNPSHTKEEWMQIQGISAYTNSDGVVVYGYYVDSSCLDTATNDYRESIGLNRLDVKSSDTYMAMYDTTAKLACINSYDMGSSYWHKCTNLTTVSPSGAFDMFYNSQGHREGMEKVATQMSSASFNFYKYVDDTDGFVSELTITIQIIC